MAIFKKKKKPQPEDTKKENSQTHEKEDSQEESENAIFENSMKLLSAEGWKRKMKKHKKS